MLLVASVVALLLATASADTKTATKAATKDTEAPRSPQLLKVGEANWTSLLRGEWMVEFHAPWCPKSQALQKEFSGLAEHSAELKIRVAEVDVTANPGLSGRFLVWTLPTIYHVTNGYFRPYTGPHEKADMVTFVKNKQFKAVSPISVFRHPNSLVMTTISHMFKFSKYARAFHDHLVEEKGVPAYVSYGVFGAAVLTLGVIGGVIMMYAIDQFFGKGARMAKASKAKKAE